MFTHIFIIALLLLLIIESCLTNHFHWPPDAVGANRVFAEGPPSPLPFVQYFVLSVHMLPHFATFVKQFVFSSFCYFVTFCSHVPMKVH